MHFSCDAYAHCLKSSETFLHVTNVPDLYEWRGHYPACRATLATQIGLKNFEISTELGCHSDLRRKDVEDPRVFVIRPIIDRAQRRVSAEGTSC